MTTRWLIDGNNVFGSRPDGWWNDREAAATRFAQRVAEWCRTHDDDVTLVFDAPVSSTTLHLAGGNLRIVESARRGRDAADDTIVDLAAFTPGAAATATDDPPDDRPDVCVVTSDRGLRRRLPAGCRTMGASGFLGVLDHTRP